MIFSHLAKESTTKGRDSQNHCLKAGVASMMMITAREIKKYRVHFPEEDDSVVDIAQNLKSEGK